MYATQNQIQIPFVSKKDFMELMREEMTFDFDAFSCCSLDGPGNDGSVANETLNNSVTYNNSISWLLNPSKLRGIYKRELQVQN
jgi:hypothetical protein